MTINREAIEKLQRKTVDVEAFGGTVRLRAMSYFELMRMEEMRASRNGNGSLDDTLALCLCFSMIDESGERIYKDGEIDIARNHLEKCAASAIALQAGILSINPLLGGEAVAATKKNSKTRRSVD